MAAKTLILLACFLTLFAGCSTPTDTTSSSSSSMDDMKSGGMAGMNMNQTPITISGTVSSIGSCADPVPSFTPAPQLQDVQPVPIEAWNRTYSGPTSASPGTTGLCLDWLDARGTIIPQTGNVVPPQTASVLVRATVAAQASYSITIMSAGPRGPR